MFWFKFASHIESKNDKAHLPNFQEGVPTRECFSIACTEAWDRNSQLQYEHVSGVFLLWWDAWRTKGSSTKVSTSWWIKESPLHTRTLRSLTWNIAILLLGFSSTLHSLIPHVVHGQIQLNYDKKLQKSFLKLFVRDRSTHKLQVSKHFAYFIKWSSQSSQQKIAENDLLKGSFSHSCFVELMHHCCQKDFTKFAASFHHLEQGL